jgi:hypothetical protein
MNSDPSGSPQHLSYAGVFPVERIRDPGEAERGALPEMVRATPEGGCTILTRGGESFEAEISFEYGRGTAGTYRLRQGPRGGRVTIKLLYEADRYRRLS